MGERAVIAVSVLKMPYFCDLKNFYGHSITVIHLVDSYSGWYKVNGRYITLMINSL